MIKRFENFSNVYSELVPIIKNGELNQIEPTIEHDDVSFSLIISLDGIIIKIFELDNKTIFSILKPSEYIFNEDSIKQILFIINNNIERLRLDETEINEISKILYLQILDKKNNIQKEFPLFTQ